MRKPEDVIKSVMTKLQKNGKGIVLMHDFQHATAAAMPELLHQLKLAGYKVVHMVPKDPVTTIDKYDDMVRAKDKFSSSNKTRARRRASLRDDQRVMHVIREAANGSGPKWPTPDDMTPRLSGIHNHRRFRLECRAGSTGTVDSGFALRAPRNDGY